MRGFSNENKKGERYAFSYQKDRVFGANIKGIGGEKHFYTKPDENSVEIEISKLEHEFAPFHNRLTQGNYDEKNDHEIAAYLLAHCSVRSKLLRMEIAMAMDLFWEEMKSIVNSKHSIFTLLEALIRDNPNFLYDDIRKHTPPGEDFSWVADMLHENPKKFFEYFNIGEIPALSAMIDMVQHRPEDFSRNAHLKALRKTSAPDALAEKFGKNNFKLVRLSNRKSVLGDCMVYYLDNRLRAIGGVSWSPAKVATILPISPELLLVNSPFPIDIRKLDPLAGPISCSYEFFVYPSEEKFLRRRTKFIGRNVGNIITSTIKDSVSGFLSA